MLCGLHQESLSAPECAEGVENCAAAQAQNGSRVLVVTEYRGQNVYLVRVTVEGVEAELVEATRLTVQKARNMVCNRWARVGRDVWADAIPEAWDMVPERRRRRVVA